MARSRRGAVSGAKLRHVAQHAIEQIPWNHTATNLWIRALGQLAPGRRSFGGELVHDETAFLHRGNRLLILLASTQPKLLARCRRDFQQLLPEFGRQFFPSSEEHTSE